MTKRASLIITAVLLVSTALFTYFVFIPTVRPVEIVSVEEYVQPDSEPEEPFIEIPEEPIEEIDILLIEWGLEKDKTSIIDAEILNRELPNNWKDRGIRFKYTYVGEFDNSTQQTVDNLLVTEYAWQKQLDIDGNVVFGGVLLLKDGTYQLHTHNTFTKAQWRYLLGDLLDRYYSNDELVGTQIKFGEVTLEAKWYRDIEIEKNSKVPFADLIISTCLERFGDRRLVSGWDVVEE